jgi:hypothetical protein
MLQVYLFGVWVLTRKAIVKLNLKTVFEEGDCVLAWLILFQIPGEVALKIIRRFIPRGGTTRRNLCSRTVPILRVCLQRLKETGRVFADPGCVPFLTNSRIPTLQYPVLFLIRFALFPGVV